MLRIRASRLLATSLLLALLAAPAHAQLRSPQVPVTGTALQSLLDAQGQTIDIATEQRSPEVFFGTYLTRPATHFFVRSFVPGSSDGLFVFDLNAPAPPPLHMISPAPVAMSPGWYTEVRFEVFPDRMIVNVFDANDVFQGSVSTLGLALVPLGLATSGPGGTFYAFDARNPDGQAHALLYWSTGIHQGGNWLCAETHTAADGGDFDYADAAFLLEYLNATPVQRTTWGTLKQRFR